MPAKKKPKAPKGEPESSYTLREEQVTMLDLPTKPPEKLPEESWLAKLAPDARLQRVVAKYRPPQAPKEQMGLGLAFGAVSDANQLDLFDTEKPR
jgi:hypothetical protein